MLSDWTEEYFAIFYISTFYTENIIKICLNSLVSCIVNVIFRWQIEEWDTQIFLKKSQSIKICSLND